MNIKDLAVSVLKDGISEQSWNILKNLLMDHDDIINSVRFTSPTAPREAFLPPSYFYDKQLYSRTGLHISGTPQEMTDKIKFVMDEWIKIEKGFYKEFQLEHVNQYGKWVSCEFFPRKFDTTFRGWNE